MPAGEQEALSGDGSGAGGVFFSGPVFREGGGPGAVLAGNGRPVPGVRQGEKCTVLVDQIA